MFENVFEELNMYDTQDPVISLLCMDLSELEVHAHTNMWIFMVALLRRPMTGNSPPLGTLASCVFEVLSCSSALTSAPLLLQVLKTILSGFLFQVASTVYVFEITDLSFCTR